MDYLIVDMARVLDESDEGRSASEELNKRWQLAQNEFEALIERAQEGDEQAAERAAELEETVPEELANSRETLQQALSTKAKAIIADLAQERGVQLVLAADQVLAHAPDVEITDQVIAKLNG